MPQQPTVHLDGKLIVRDAEGMVQSAPATATSSPAGGGFGGGFGQAPKTVNPDAEPATPEASVTDAPVAPAAPKTDSEATKEVK